MPTIPVEQFPILTPGQMNPFNQAFSSGLDAYQNIQKSAYMPQQLQADILSKAAYAAYKPYEMQASILQNPFAVAALAQTPGALEKFIGNFSNMPKNPLDVMRQYQQGSGSGSTGGIGSLWDGLKQSLGMGGATNPATNGYTPHTSSTNAYEYDANGNNITATPQEVADIANGKGASQGGNPAVQQYVQSNPAAQQALQSTGQYTVPQSGASTPSGTGNLMGSAFAKMFPLSQQAINLEAQKKAAEQASGTQAHVQAQAYQNYMSESSKNATQAQQGIMNLDDFWSNYQQATLKGPLAGLTEGTRKIAEFDPHTVEAANAANNVVLSSVGIMTGNKPSDYRTQLVQNSKVSPYMPEDAAKHVHDKQTLMLQRTAQIPEFNQEAAKYGVQNVNQLQGDFVDYNMKYRLVNSDGKLQPQNLNKIQDYFANKYGNGATQASNPPASVQGFDPTKMLDYKFKTPEEFKASFNTLGPEAQAKVRAEMKRRGWN